MSTVPNSARLFKPDSLPLTLCLLADGWEPGAPPHLTIRSVAIDAWTAGQLLCASCGKKGMRYRPFRLHGNYCAVAVCKCGGQEEV